MRPSRLVALLIAAGLFAVATAASATPAEAPSAPPARTPPANAVMDRAPEPLPWEGQEFDIPWLRLLSGTALVVALICGGLWVLKKLNGGLPLSRGRYLELIESRPVGRNVQLFLVRVGERVLLLAAGSGNVTSVAELSADELPVAETDQAAGGVEGFRLLLKRMAGAGS
jgi:flagellar biosynthetic protein FliO